VVEARAWGFSRSLVPEGVLRERVLEGWSEGARLEEFEWGWVLHLPRAVRVHVEEAPGMALVQHKNALVSAPVSLADAPENGVWVVENGGWRELRGGRSVDVSEWVDVGTWQVEESSSLGEVAPIPVAFPPVTLDLRSQSGIGAPDPKWQAIWERGGSPSRFDFEPALWLRGLSRVLTPPRMVDGKIIASDASIVLSAMLLVGGALVFLLLALWRPQSAPGFSSAAFNLVCLLAVGAWVWQRRSGRESSSAKPLVPLLVASHRVQLVTVGLLAVGMLRLTFAYPDGGSVAVFLLAFAWGILRRTGLMVRLVGSTQAGTANSAGKESWLARFLQKNAGTKGETLVGASASIWARWFGKKKESSGKAQPSLGDAWRRFLAQLALESGLFKHLSRAQARFLLRSMELFERGDLEAALRHALPLGGGVDNLATPPALSVPNARDSLAISPHQGRARGTLNFGPEVEAKLRALYRKAFEKLRDAGEVDRAAFVLAELLQNSAEAVTFLETHGQLELAAQIAEGRRLPPGLVVRAWWLAGNRQRAISLARLHGAFADAVLRLERDPKQVYEALSLRLLWANELAEQGRFGAAIEAIGNSSQGSALARKWLRLGLQAAPSDAKLLVRALQLEPGSWKEWQPLLQELWHAREENSPANRLRFARELAKVSPGKDEKSAMQVAARATVRALVGDAAGSGERLDKNEWEKLQTLADDGILRADVRLPSPAKAPVPASPVEIRIEGNEGTLAPRDAVWLESGELLVALGEAGAQLRGRDGKVKAHFDVPAHQIVRPFEGNRALLLAPRDDSMRVCQLDVGARRAKVWGDLRLEDFCDSFNGAVWFVASEGRVHALDITAPSPVALWDCGDMDGKVIDMALGGGSLSALVSHIWAQGFVLESWRFDVPSLLLRERRIPKAFPPPTPATSMRRVFANGEQFSLDIKPIPTLNPPSETETTHLFCQGDDQDFPIEETPIQFFGAATSTRAAMIGWQNAGGSVATLLDLTSSRVGARLHFLGAGEVRARECGGFWLVWDDRGRMALFDPASGSLRRQWALS